MNPKPLVVDASVILKWYLSPAETYQKQALLLYERFRQGELSIQLPDFALYELGNRFSRMGLPGLEIFSDVLNLFPDATYLSRSELRQTAKLIIRARSEGLNKATIYDGAYIMLALALGKPLVTADELQIAMAELAGVQVINIKDYR